MKVKALLGAAIAVISLNAFAMDTDTATSTDAPATQATQPKHHGHKHKHKHHVSKKKARKTTHKMTADNSSTDITPATDTSNDISTN